jgi:hypothetical protein
MIIDYPFGAFRIENHSHTNTYHLLSQLCFFAFLLYAGKGLSSILDDIFPKMLDPRLSFIAQGCYFRQTFRTLDSRSGDQLHDPFRIGRALLPHRSTQAPATTSLFLHIRPPSFLFRVPTSVSKIFHPIKA